MLTLYVAQNTIAIAAQIALAETGLPHEVRWISFPDAQHRKPDYLALNAKGRVPALVCEHGTLTETPAILEYIADTSGTLIPTDIFQSARVREMMAYCASTFHVNHAHKLRGARWSDDPAAHATMTAKVPQTMAESAAQVETQLPDGGWLTGAYSIADIHLYAVCRWLKTDGVNIANTPKLAAHFVAMGARAAVKSVEATHA